MMRRMASRGVCSAAAGPLWTRVYQPAGHAEASAVSGAAFTELLRKTGLSGTPLRSLYPLHDGIEAREGEFPLAVALSGGGDSMALMLLLREHLLHRRIRTPLLAITVDHRLRPESREEAAQLAKICSDRWGVRHVTQQCQWSQTRPEPRANKLEEEARRFRYELLRGACAQHGVRCLFVAHTLGDQLETTLFRLGRASGVNGLAGMSSVSTFVASDEDEDSGLVIASEEAAASKAAVRLVRPLLTVSKNELRATCNRFEQPWIEDPTNNSLAFDRVRIRKELERLEKERGRSVIDLLARFQASAAAAKKELSRVERRILRKYLVKSEPGLVILRSSFQEDPEMFDELCNRIYSSLIMRIGSKDTPPRLEAVIRLVRDLEKLDVGKTVTLGGCCVSRRAKGQHLHFRSERPTDRRTRRSESMVDL